jgi:N-acyl-D-amino-acid deacylase
VDAYPYLAGSCNLTQLLPAWCQEGGIEALLGRLQSPALRNRIARETEEGMSNTWNDIVICNVRLAQARGLLGQTVQKLADARGRSAVETALDLLVEQEGFVYIISFNNNDENLRKVLTYSRTAVITDGMVTDGTPHPRTFGTYPKFLGECVREKRPPGIPTGSITSWSTDGSRCGTAGSRVNTPESHCEPRL